MHVRIRVEIADLGGGPWRAPHVIDQDLRVELDDLDTRTGVGIEVLGSEHLVQARNDDAGHRQDDDQHNRDPHLLQATTQHPNAAAHSRKRGINVVSSRL
jgi:uncharacterized membrane-anchored protein